MNNEDDSTSTAFSDNYSEGTSCTSTSTLPTTIYRPTHADMGINIHASLVALSFFRILNDRCFDNTLPEIKISAVAMERELHGYFKPKTLEIVINARLGDKQIEKTMYHEMIHYYIHYKGIKDGDDHGMNFKKIYRRFNKVGIHE